MGSSQSQAKVRKPGPSERRRNRERANVERANVALKPTPEELAMIAARAALLANGQPPIIAALAARLGISKTIAFQRRCQCVAKGLIPEREAPEDASERGRMAADCRKELLDCAKAMAPRGGPLDALEVSKRLGWTYNATRNRIRDLRRAGSWIWTDPPRPVPARAVVDAFNPLDRVEPPAAVVAEVDAARLAVTSNSPSRKPPGRVKPPIVEVRRSVDFNRCEVDDMVREWKARRRRARHARQA